MDNTEQDFERTTTMMWLTSFVMKSAIAFLLPTDNTLSSLGFREVLLKGINDDSIISVFDTPEKHEMFKSACLAVVNELDQIVGGKDA